MTRSTKLSGPGERQRWAHVESARDAEVLAWVARFQFVTLDVLAERFAVSAARMGVRVRRLEQLGYLRRITGLVGQAHVIYLAPAGAKSIGSPRRRAPRPSLQRDHELALTQLVCKLELARPDLKVLTERDAREQESTGERRFSVDVYTEHGERAKRWPDVSLTDGRVAVALEVEVAAKGTARLRRIIDAYVTSHLTRVRFLVNDPVVGGRIARISRESQRGTSRLGMRSCQIEVAPWMTVTTDLRQRIEESIEAAN